MKTLVLTDQYLLGQTMAEYLTHPQISARTVVCRTSAALEEAKRERPDIVVLDLNALPFGALSMIAALRNLENKVNVILLLTGREGSAFVRHLLAAGVSGIFSRNSSMEDLSSCFAAAAAGKAFLSDDTKQLIAERRGSVADINLLSKRELQIALLVAKGTTSKEVAALVQLSIAKVNWYRHNILRKLKLKKTIALINLLAGFDPGIEEVSGGMTGRNLA